MDPKSPINGAESTATSKQRPFMMHNDDSGDGGAGTATMNIDADSTRMVVPVAPTVDTVPQDPDIFEEVEEDSFSHAGTEHLLSNPNPLRDSELESLKFSPKPPQRPQYV